MKLILGDSEVKNTETMSLEEARENHFYCNTYEQCNPIDKLKTRLKMYSEIDFFSLREGKIEFII